MTQAITFGSEHVLANNLQFASLFKFAVSVGEKQCRHEIDRGHMGRMKRLIDEEFWPGRYVEIETDFPDLAERKFWSRVFYDTARAIFDRTIGNHDHSFWQAQRICQAYDVGRLFEQAARSVEPRWTAPTIDRTEFERIVNDRELDSE